MVKIKICGITCKEDATWAVNLGADFIGLNFFKDSPRKISPQNAAEIIMVVPSFIAMVGIFVNEDLKIITKTSEKLNLRYLQLHGEETPQYCQQLKNFNSELKIIKAFRMKSEETLEILAPYQNMVDFFLLDAYVPEVLGGTGTVFNWDLAVKAKDYGKPIFLSGGLNQDNVVSAIEKVRPFAVDVCSGIERSAKRKDYQKMKEFIAKAKSVQYDLIS